MFLASLTIALLLFAGQLVMSAVQERLADDRKPSRPNERVFAVSVQQARYETISPEQRAFGLGQSRRTPELRAAPGGRGVCRAARLDDGGPAAPGRVCSRRAPPGAQAA